jgi:hypothetical protein
MRESRYAINSDIKKSLDNKKSNYFHQILKHLYAVSYSGKLFGLDFTRHDFISLYDEKEPVHSLNLLSFKTEYCNDYEYKLKNTADFVKTHHLENNKHHPEY